MIETTNETKNRRIQQLKTIAKTLWAIAKKIYKFIFFKLTKIEETDGHTKRIYIARKFKKHK